MREFFRSFICSFNTSLDLQARALGVTRRRLVAINMWFWLFLLALVLLPCGARAQVAGLCGPGKDCKVRSVQSTTARANFPPCAASRYGAQIVDGDAGVLRLCQRDGGWEEVGASGSSGESFWFDGGGGYIAAGETVRNPDGGPLRFSVPDVTGTPQPAIQLGTPNTSGTGAGALIFAESEGNPAAGNGWGAIWTQRTTSGLRLGGMNYVASHMNAGGGAHMFSNGLDPVSPTRNLVKIHDNAGAGGVITIISASGHDSVRLDTNGARLHLGTGSLDYLESDGTYTVTAGGIRIGGTSATPIGSSFAGTIALDGGPLAAASCELNDVTASGCLANAQCVVGRAQGQTTGLGMECWVHDGSAIKLQVCNLTSVSVPKVAGNYTTRCFNP